VFTTPASEARFSGAGVLRHRPQENIR